MLNLPNTITLIRILLVPVFLMVFWSPVRNHAEFGMAILAAAGLTDVLDGYLARKYHLVTPLGKVLDPIADKFMVIAAMVSLFLVGRFPLWLVALVLGKDLILVVGSSFVVLRERNEVSASIYGKIATVWLYTAIFAAAFQIRGNAVIAVIAGLISILALASYVRGFVRQHVC